MNSVSESIHIGNNSLSGRDIYDDVQEIAIEDITRQLEKMIESSDTFDGWVLSVKDGTRLIKILNSKKRIIKSSFKFQLKQNFSNFKSVPKTRFDQNLTRDRHSLKLTDVDLAAEYQALELIVVGCEQSYSDFYALSCQRLQHCVQRNHISETENPVHVKRLCEAFQYSLDTLNLDSKFQIALYRLFSHVVIDNLDLTYEKIDQCLINNNILPTLQLRKAESEIVGRATKAEIKIDSLTKQAKQSKPKIDNKVTSSKKAKSSGLVKPKKQTAPEKGDAIALQVSKAESDLLGRSTKAKNKKDSLTKKAKQSKSKVDNKITSSKKAKSSARVKPKKQAVPKEADVIPEPQLQQTIEKDPLPLKTIDHAAEIHKGDWVEIMQKNGTKMAKLVWKSVDCSLLIFVDNIGNRIRELSGSQLNKEFEDGSMTLVTTSSVASNKECLSVVQPFKGR